MLQGKKIILAVSGSIAAYKAPQLTRLLVKAGAEVQVLMTEGAKDFVAPLTLSTVAQKRVISSFISEDQWNNHVHIGLWADVMLIAPCSAHTLARMAHGICDNIVQAVYLSARCPVIVAPAMDDDMWHHPSTKKNLDAVKSYGNTIIYPEKGDLASGITGDGRMVEPENIVQFIDNFLKRNNSFQGINNDFKGKGLKALVTAGPTYESIDPVRYIGNHSSGRMGIAIAESLARNGLEVHLILGPTHLKADHPGIYTQNVTSAQEMYKASVEVFPDTHIAVLSAAVADFRPVTKSDQKIKKTDEGTIVIELIKNPDILAHLGKVKEEHQIVAGFALETTDELQNAQKKLKSKNADFIFLNSLNDEGAGFGYETNKITILEKDNDQPISLPLLTKEAIAENIVNCLLKKLKENV